MQEILLSRREVKYLIDLYDLIDTYKDVVDINIQLDEVISKLTSHCKIQCENLLSDIENGISCRQLAIEVGTILERLDNFEIPRALLIYVVEQYPSLYYYHKKLNLKLDTLNIKELLYTNYDKYASDRYKKMNPHPDKILKAVYKGNYEYIKDLIDNNCDFNLALEPLREYGHEDDYEDDSDDDDHHYDSDDGDEYKTYKRLYQYSVVCKYFRVSAINGDFKMVKLFYEEMKKEKYHISEESQASLFNEALTYPEIYKDIELTKFIYTKCNIKLSNAHIMTAFTYANTETLEYLFSLDHETVELQVCQGLTCAYNKDAIKFVYERFQYSEISFIIFNIISKDLDMIKYLFEIGYTIRPDEHYDITLLISKNSVLSYLIDKGLNINSSKDNLTPLIYNIINPDLDNVKLLLKNGAVVDYRSLRTVLHLDTNVKNYCMMYNLLSQKLQIFKLMLSKVDDLDALIKNKQFDMGDHLTCNYDDLIDTILAHKADGNTFEIAACVAAHK